jgi:hypothetical protein
VGKFWTTVNGKRKRTAAGVAHEYEKFQSSPKAKAERSARNSARRSALKSGRVHKGDGKEVDHRNSAPTDNRSSNLRVVSRKTNRSKKENSRRRGSRRNRSTWGI